MKFREYAITVYFCKIFLNVETKNIKRERKNLICKEEDAPETEKSINSEYKYKPINSNL